MKKFKQAFLNSFTNREGKNFYTVYIQYTDKWFFGLFPDSTYYYVKKLKNVNKFILSESWDKRIDEPYKFESPEEAKTIVEKLIIQKNTEIFEKYNSEIVKYKKQTLNF